MTDEQRAKRIHHHMYETCEGIREHVERIVALEELVTDMYASMDVSCQFLVPVPPGTMAHVKNRVVGLGIEVDE